MMAAVEMKTCRENFALLDIEYIQTHKCTRKLYILTRDGRTELESDFYPCVQYWDLSEKYKRVFRYCRKHVHKLRYDPICYSPECSKTVEILRNFIHCNKISFILYKGGTIERDLCTHELCIPSYNMEECLTTTMKLEKAGCHDPRTEIRYYYDQLQMLGYI